MWTYRLVISILIFNCVSYFDVHSQEIFIIDDNINSTLEEFLIPESDLSLAWTNQQFIVCFVSVTLGTLLFFLTFIVPAMIIIRRARKDKNRCDLRELRRMSDFM